MRRFVSSLRTAFSGFVDSYLRINPILQQLLIFVAVFLIFGVAFSVFAVLPKAAFIISMQLLMGGFVLLVLYIAYRMFRE